MKQKDIATIIIAVVISAGISFFLSGKVFAPPKARMQNVEVIPSITNDFPTPDTKYFNSSSIDPTQLIQIGNNNNNNPFTSH